MSFTVLCLWYSSWQQNTTDLVTVFKTDRPVGQDQIMHFSKTRDAYEDYVVSANTLLPLVGGVQSDSRWPSGRWSYLIEEGHRRFLVLRSFLGVDRSGDRSVCCVLSRAKGSIEGGFPVDKQSVALESIMMAAARFRLFWCKGWHHDTWVPISGIFSTDRSWFGSSHFMLGRYLPTN